MMIINSILQYDSTFDDDHINISYESTWSQRAPEGVRSQLDPLGASGGELQGWAGEDDHDDSGEVHVHENVEDLLSELPTQCLKLVWQVFWNQI